MKKCVIFDVDGTLNQTAIYAIPAYRRAMKKRGRAITDEEVLSIIGLSPAMIIEQLFGELNGEELDSWRQDIRQYEFDFMDEEAAAFPGMEETLQKLQNQGYELAICSNAFPEHIRHVLQAIKLEPYFDMIGSLEMGTSKEMVLKNLIEAMDCDEAYMVGDRRFDVEAARHCNIPIIGCAYGYAPEEIRDADYIVQSASEISELLETKMNNVQIMIADVNDFKEQTEYLLTQIAPCYVAKYEKHKIWKDKIQEVVSGFLLKKYLGVSRDEQLRYNEFEKPMLASGKQFFNLSHSGDYVALGIADCELGIDVERVRKCHDAMVKKVFRIEQQEEIQALEGKERDEKFTEIWTKYESVLKLEGSGIARGYKAIPVEKYPIVTRKIGEYYISCATEGDVGVEIIRVESE